MEGTRVFDQRLDSCVFAAQKMLVTFSIARRRSLSTRIDIVGKPNHGLLARGARLNLPGHRRCWPN
jgi:hypothetical protein